MMILVKMISSVCVKKTHYEVSNIKSEINILSSILNMRNLKSITFK